MLVNPVLAILIEKLESFVIIVDKDANVLLWNKTSENCFGIPREYSIGKNIISLPIIWNKKEIVDFLSQDNIEEIKMSNMEIERVDNQKRWINCRIYKIRIPDEDSLFTFFIGNDITEEKKSFELLKEDNKFKAIGELSAGIAHEINSPLQYVHNNLTFISDVLETYIGIFDKIQLLHPDNDNSDLKTAVRDIAEETSHQYELISSEAKDAIEQSMEGVKRIETIVNSLKNYAHPEKNEPVRLNLIAVIKDSINLSINEWKYVADIETYFPEGPLYIEGFPTYLSQVIVNILVNAGHAIEELKSIKKIVRGLILLKVYEEKQKIVIEIKDNGIGMREEIRSRIFEPFFTTKGIGKGTGQGLAIAYSIITNKHNGKISCESNIGKGTSFLIELPHSAEK